MTAEEREAFQCQLLEDEQTATRVREAEVELFDAYARGRLPAEFRADFENKLLRDPHAPSKLATARGLARLAGRRAWRVPVLAAAAGLLLAAVGLALFLRKGPATPPAPPAAVVVFPIQLEAVTRGASVPVFRISPDATEVELRAPVAGVVEGTQCTVELRNTAGAVLWSTEARLQAGVRFRVPRPLLAPGAFEVRVSQGGQPIAFFDLRIDGP
jgi:hypothetical protein